MKHRNKITGIFSLLLSVSLACSFSDFTKLPVTNSTPTPDTTTINTPAVKTPAASSSGRTRFVPTTDPSLLPTSEPEYTSSIESNGEGDLDMTDSLYIQNGRNLLTFFLLENTYEDGVDQIEYTVTASDEMGNEIKTDTGIIDYIAPGEHAGVVSQMFLPEGQKVGGVYIDWTYYTFATPPVKLPFTFINPRYFSETNWDRMTVLMNNMSTYAYTYVQVDMIALDANGNLTGGGRTTLNFVPGLGEVGLSFNGLLSDEPVTYEVFPQLTIISSKVDDSKLSSEMPVLQAGFNFDDTKLGGGFLIENNTQDVIRGAEYNLSIFDKDDTVVQVASGILPLLWPGQIMAISPGTLNLPQGTSDLTYTLNLLSGQPFDQEFTQNPLIAKDPVYDENYSSPKVNFSILNTSATDIKNPFTTVLLFNEEGNIVGGGFGYPGLVPANGSLSFDVYVTYTSVNPPARVEAYVSPSSY